MSMIMVEVRVLWDFKIKYTCNLNARVNSERLVFGDNMNITYV